MALPIQGKSPYRPTGGYPQAPPRAQMPGTNAAAGQMAGTITDPRAPTYRLPGSNLPDPRYAQKQQQYNVDEAGRTDFRNAQQRGAANWTSNIANQEALGLAGHMNVDAAGNATYQYSFPGGAGGAGGRGGGPQDRVSLQSLLGDYNQSFKVPAHVTGPDRFAREAANSAAFARAKDRVGMTTRGSLKALQNMMSARGIAGSGIEGALGANVLTAGSGQLGDTIREQTLADLAREQQVEDRNYSGDVTQRAQDISVMDQKRAALAEFFRMRAGQGMGDVRMY